MKCAILILTTLIFSRPGVYGQPLSLAVVPGLHQLRIYSPGNDNDAPHLRRMCITTKAGLITMGAGAILFCVGVKMSDDYTHHLAPHDPGGNNQGIAVYLAGVVLFNLGAGLAIGGGIHDIVSYHRRQLSIIAPHRDEIGLAWRF